MKFKQSTIRALVFLTLVLIGSTSAAFAADNKNPTPIKSPKAPCRLELETPHISSSLLKSKGTLNMKANVSSICDLPQSQTEISITLFKMGLVDHAVAQKVYQMSKNEVPRLVVEFKGTYALCVTKEPTRYYSKAFAKAYIGGKWLFAGTVKSLTSDKIMCGSKSLNPFF